MSRGAVILLSIVGGLIVIGLAALEIGFGTGNLKLGILAPSGPTDTQQFRAAVIDSSKKSCIKTATERAPKLAAQKIEAYCDCFSAGAVDLLTEDDVRYMLDHLGTMPPNLQQRLDPLIARCRTAALGNS
jgi:ubiquinone/menaquinone biosynthesis C-methylase UbiE